MQKNAGNNEKKTRSKAAKIVLWSLVGCIGAILLVMIVWVLIAAFGGTGTSNGGILGLGFNTVTTVFGVFVVALIMTWMLTEPSFKKEEEIIVEVKPQYVKKSARPQPVKKEVSNVEPKPEAKEAEATESENNDNTASEENSEDDAEPDPASEPLEADSTGDDIDDDDDGINDDDDVDDDAEPDDDIEEAAQDTDIGVVVGASAAIEYKYRRSFMSKLIQSSDNTKDYYSDIKNKLLSYKNMRARASWSYESFNSGRSKIAKINIKGKTLVLYLALDPAEYANTKYHIKDMSSKTKYASVPVMVRVKSPRGAKFAIELIEQVAEKKGLVADPKFSKEKYKIKYKSTEKLIEEGLIKTL